MILDHLAQAALYSGLSDGLVQALHFLQHNDPAALALGRHDLDGDRIFALVQEYETRPRSACRWEAHRRYCDVQFLAAGVERIGVAPRDALRLVDAYDEHQDVAFYDGDGDFVTLRTGMFAMLWPHDAHMPCVASAGLLRVRKIVVKVAV